MPKTIVDIVPLKEEETEGEEEKKEKKKPKAPKETHKEKVFAGRLGLQSKKLALLIIITGATLIVLIGMFLFLRTRLTIYIQPLEETIKVEKEIKLDISQGALDLEQEIIPAQLFETTEEIWEIFQATGKELEGEKAGGIIVVYNSFSPPSAIALREQTRFLSSENGRIFRSLEKIQLPAAQIKSGKVVPSATQVKVIAQEPGEDYNIGPSKFSVPGLAGAASYYAVWGESTKNMEGGVKKEVKKITKEDIEAAKDGLREKLQTAAKTSLKNKVPAGLVLNEKAIFEEDFQASCPQEAGSKVNEFNCKGTIKLKGLACLSEDLNQLARQFLLNNIVAPKQLVPQSLNFSFLPKGNITSQGGMIVGLEIEGKVYEEVNKDVFVSQIKGETEETIKETVLKDYPQIEKADFKFWPFWVKKAPKKVNRIKIILTF